MKNALLAGLPILIVACGARDRHPLAIAKIDTLPGHIVSVTSPGPTDWADSAHAWRLVEVQRIGGAAGTPGELIEPRSVAVDDAGRIYVADDKPAIIKVFAADGRFLHVIGHEGEGPGEFRVAFLAIHGSNLIVHDPQVTRTSVFDTSGTFLKSWTSTCCYYSPIDVDSAGRVYLPSMIRGDQKQAFNYLRYKLDGSLVDTLTVPELQEGKSWVVRNGKNALMSARLPASPQMVAVINPAGGVLYGFSADYRIIASRDGSDTTTMFSRTWTAAPVSSAWRHAAVEQMIARAGKIMPEALLRASFKESEIPPVFPAYDAISVDRNGNRWVRLPNAADTITSLFDVFDSGGRYLGAVTAARAFPVYGAMAWGRDDFYVSLESDDGTPSIVRFHVDRGTVQR